jgi:mono/diheme cytochrome c family protein
MNARRALRGLTAAGIALAWAIAHASQPAASHIADADDPLQVTSGKPLYMLWCASCHGRRLQGQPLWQLADQFVGKRAPAHDETGHTWQHSDEELFHMTKFGRFPATPSDVASFMPAFKDALRDDEILAVMAFIKARWPLGLRISQAMLNPDYAGMPPEADHIEWTLPPTCTGSAQRWRSGSR